MTLIEVLFALVIITIGLVGLAAVVPISSYGIQQGNQLSTATFLAEQRLEQLKAAQWTDSPSAVDCVGVSTNTSFDAGGAAPSGFVGACNPANFNDETPTGSALPNPYSRYTRQVRIQSCVGGACYTGSDAAVRQVTVRVTFTPLQGIGGVATTAPQFVQLTMRVAKR